MNSKTRLEKPVVDVLILGAGAAGLAAGLACSYSGVSFSIIDKGRFPGGRMCTRNLGTARLDYGAQFFTTRQEPDLNWISKGIKEQKLKPWLQATESSNRPHPTRWIPSNGFRAWAQDLASQPVYMQAHAASLHTEANLWHVRSLDQRMWTARSLILTFPLPQALAWLDDQNIGPIPHILRQVYYHPCLALLCRTTQTPAWSAWLEPTQAEAEVVAFVGDNQHKGLSPVPALTVHCSPGFSAAYYSAPVEVILQHVRAALGEQLPPVAESDLMRWRYSQTANPLTELFWPLELDALPPLVLAGDAFGRSRIESAFHSGWAAARAVIAQIQSS